MLYMNHLACKILATSLRMEKAFTIQLQTCLKIMGVNKEVVPKKKNINDAGSELAPSLGELMKMLFNTYADIEAVYKCLEESYGAKQDNIILYGHSVGSGPMLDLAARLPHLRAMVLHSPILSGLRVMYPVKRTYWFDIYKNIDKIPYVNCPVLIIHLTRNYWMCWLNTQSW